MRIEVRVSSCWQRRTGSSGATRNRNRCHPEARFVRRQPAALDAVDAALQATAIEIAPRHYTMIIRAVGLACTKSYIGDVADED